MIPVLFALPVALTLLAVADVLAGLAPRWVIPVAVLFLLAGFAPVPGADFIQIALGLAAFGRIAYRILRMTDAEWESGPAARALPSCDPSRPRLQPDRASTGLVPHLRRCQSGLLKIPLAATGTSINVPAIRSIRSAPAARSCSGGTAAAASVAAGPGPARLGTPPRPASPRACHHRRAPARGSPVRP